MKHQPFPSIEQLRNVVTVIDYHFPEEKPTISFDGTVKIHGTNAAICSVFNGDSFEEPYYQSRQIVLDKSNTNSGFYNFANERKNYWLDCLTTIKKNHVLQQGDTVSIFGEWCGEGIESGCAIQKLSKRFIVFGLLITGENGIEFWENHSFIFEPALNVYNINNYQKYSITIDFNKPQEVEEFITNLVNEVEQECPVAKAFGVSGLGEGIVWIGKTILPNNDPLRIVFKTKGIKHKISETKKVVSVSAEVTSSIEEFITYAVTKNRVDQAITTILGQGSNDRPMNKFKDILFWVYEDIQKEESDVLLSNNLTWDQVKNSVSPKVKELYLAL